MKKKIAKRVVLGLVALYLLSYFAVSWGGFYEPIAYGALQGRDGRVVMAPKGSIGYRWIPFESYNQTGGIDGRSIHGWAYYPLLMVDRAVWHTSDKWKDRPDLTRNYFDYDAVEYRPGKKDKANKSDMATPRKPSD
jgi:hypothetical protein